MFPQITQRKTSPQRDLIVENSKSASVSDWWIKYYQKSCNSHYHEELLKTELLSHIPSHK
jgi:hypothetical protein